MKLFIPLIAISAAAASLLSCSCERRADAAINSNPNVQSPPAAPPTADPETMVPERQPYQPETEAQLRARLTDLEYEITKNSATERAGTGKFDKHYEDGIYVCIISGEPLFSSKDKYDSGCGWPAFTKPIDGGEIEERKDYKFGWDRVEVRARTGDSHLGHVFTDGPQETGGLRYCINSGSLRFVPKDKLVEEGYGKYAHLFEEGSK